MMQLTEEQRKALIECAKKLITGTRSDNVAKLAEIALAALTAEAVAWSDGDFTEDYTSRITAKKTGGNVLALYTATPVAELRPIELPSAFTPAVTSFGPSPVSSMRLDHMGGWLNKARVIAAIREAGYEVNATATAEGAK